MSIHRKLFGTDGVRGVANVEPITSETALKLGRALAHVFRNNTGRHRKILIGKDTRLSGYMLETAIESGICSMGVDVWLVGPLPTPAIAFLTRSMRADAGVVISASHNPFQDNGIKFFSREGFKLDDETERRIEALVFDEAEIAKNRARPDDIGKAARIDDALGRYLVFLKSCLPRSVDLRRPEGRDRLRQRRRLQGRSRSARGTRRRGRRDRSRSRRQEHQSELRRDASRRDSRNRSARALPRRHRARRRRRSRDADRRARRSLGRRRRDGAARAQARRRRAASAATPSSPP